MTRAISTVSSIEQTLIDRLVDGELSDQERRALLIRLDAEPTAWRRCALAFLEAQSWREVLGPLARSAVPADTPEGTQSSSAAELRPLPKRALRSVVGLAAGLLVAFSMGWAAGGGFRMAGNRTPASNGQLVRHSPPHQDGNAPPPREVRPEAPNRSGTEAKDPIGSAPEVKTVAVLNLAGADGPAPACQVPILAGPGIDESWLRRQPLALPEYVQRQLERRGYQVEQRRRLISMNLKDGRRLAVPVDEVELQFVGSQPQ